MTLTTPTKFLKVVLNIYVFATVVLAEQLPQIEDKEEAGAVQEIHGGIPHSSGSTNLVLKLLFILLVVGVLLYLRKKKVEVWPDLIASPKTFNHLLDKLQVVGYRFVDVYDHSSIPSSAKALLILQKFDPEVDVSSQVDSTCKYVHQVERGSCGTLSVVNCVALSALVERNRVIAPTMIPELQQLLSTGIVKQDKWAQVNTLLKEYHYYAAGRKLTSVYETKSQFTKSASGQYVGPPINNHFIVLIPRKDGTVVEVDTMKDKAIIRGTWLKEGNGFARGAAHALAQKYHTNPDAMGCLMALVPSN